MRNLSNPFPFSKYKAKKSVVDNVLFHSKGEAKRYKDLALLQKLGKIANLILQPKFLLQAGFKRNGEKIRPIFYIADFMYDKNGTTIVEDFKGFETPEFKIKRKLFMFRYPDLEFKIVKT